MTLKTVSRLFCTTPLMVAVTTSSTLVHSQPVVDPIMQLEEQLRQRESVQTKPVNFADWKMQFAAKAVAQGHAADDVERLLSGAHMNERIISLDRSQAEFAKMPWEYVDSAVSTARVEQGQQNFSTNRSLFNSIENRFGVDAEYVAGIWGMESSYGAVTGSSSIASSLATLAFEGRRRDFAENQLLALLTLFKRGDVRWGYADGSWAGGMGHTQFIPATWLAQGVDADGDGRTNPWAKADALSTTANYLANSGWVRGLSPFYEVHLPQGFDHKLIGQKLSFAQWRAAGLLPLSGAPNASTPLELWLPAGIEGPALLLSQNFDVIKVYNNSSSYALGVSLLGKAIARSGGLQANWPRFEKPLSTTQVLRLQQLLTNQGYDTQGADGIIGSNTKKAFARWQSAHGQVPDGFISQRTAGALVH